MNIKLKSLAIASSIVLIGSFATPATAHVSVVPGVSAAGNTTDALTVGKNNTLGFRVGHGCGLEADIKHPVTKKTIATAGVSTFGTHAFSVTVPVEALGAAGTTAPRPAFIPGFRTSIVKNANGTMTVTWKAISRDFDVPNGPTGDVATTSYFDFGLRVNFAPSASGKKVTFPAKQRCLVDVPAVKRTATTKARAATTISVYETWDGSTVDDVKDNNSRSTAPSVTVF
jgi:uncharacterized protein YcnI